MRFLGLCWLTIVGLGLIIIVEVRAQPKPQAEKQTRMWELPRSSRSYGSITVYDTAGVCIYWAYTYQGSALTAVPKTQLPQGAGCQ